MNLDDFRKKVILERDVIPPEGYLKGLEDQVFLELSKGKKSSKVRRLWLGVGSIAAAMLILVFIAKDVNENPITEFAQLPVEYQLDYYFHQTDFFPEVDEDWILDLGPDELVELLAMDYADDDVFDYLYKNVKR